ncbi:MAG TPA: GAF domain-containing protein, partial [Thermoleophilaceae bacterium]
MTELARTQLPLGQWLALDADIAPALRARQLRREWEHFLSGGPVSGIRTPVADSWQRSLDAGVAPAAGWWAPTASDRVEALERWEHHPLRQTEPLIRDCLGGLARESGHLIVVSDAAGVLLMLEGDAGVRSRAADSMNFTEGAVWSEDGAGTNAIGTALAADHAVQIFAAEHFAEVVQAWTCSAAPVHDPDTGHLLGVIDLTGLQQDVHPHSLSIAVTTARAVESHLSYRLQQRDAGLRARHQDRITGRGERHALVTPTGRVIADDARGWLGAERLVIPPGGGDFVLPTGERALADPLGPDEAFVVRELTASSGRPPRERLRILDDEQAALRRLATAVAQSAPPSEIFTAVANEIGPLLGAEDAALIRFEPGHTATVLAGAGQWVREFGIGRQLEVDDLSTIGTVRRTARSIRLDDRTGTPAPVVAYLRRRGLKSSVASPIVVEGRIWGALVAATRKHHLPADTEKRMANFTELVGVVIANAEGRAELTASRARVVAAADEARRRIQRDLHDGAQQRLVSTVLALKLALRELENVPMPATELVDEALTHAEAASAELRELAHGILPSALATGGLRDAIDALVGRVHLPVAVDVTAARLPAALEATAYFIVAEALTNTMKHSGATEAEIRVAIDGEVLSIAVRDDGVGGASTDGNSGLVGLHDRAAAVEGGLRVVSPLGGGTLIAATL